MIEHHRASGPAVCCALHILSCLVLTPSCQLGITRHFAQRERRLASVRRLTHSINWERKRLGFRPRAVGHDSSCCSHQECSVHPFQSQAEHKPFSQRVASPTGATLPGDCTTLLCFNPFLCSYHSPSMDFFSFPKCLLFLINMCSPFLSQLNYDFSDLQGGANDPSWIPVTCYMYLHHHTCLPALE